MRAGLAQMTVGSGSIDIGIIQWPSTRWKRRGNASILTKAGLRPAELCSFPHRQV